MAEADWEQFAPANVRPLPESNKVFHSIVFHSDRLSSFCNSNTDVCAVLYAAA